MNILVNNLPNKDIPAIYCLYFKNYPKRKYYGCTSYLNKRLKIHLKKLIINEHSNPNLQKDFLKYGIKQLCWDIVFRNNEPETESTLILSDIYCYNYILYVKNGYPAYLYG